MVIVHSFEELIENYSAMEDPETPNLMLQEYIPGDDDQIYIFNGYFDRSSRCLAGFTGQDSAVSGPRRVRLARGLPLE